MTDKNTFVREPALPLLLQQIEQGSIEINEENTPFIKINEKKVQRVNIVGIVVQKELIGSITNLIVDDGTGKIIVRSFEEIKGLNTTEVGTVLRIIGKIRIFNSEKYVSPEIIKPTPAEWVKYQHKLLQEFITISKNDKTVIEEIEIIKDPAIEGPIKTQVTVPPLPSLKNEKKVNLETNILVGEETPTLPFEKIAVLIKKLDSGPGALIEEIIEQSTMEDTEKIIEKMLENGEIFQNQPGKVKVL